MLILTGVIIVICVAIFMIARILINTFGEKYKDGYLASTDREVILYTEEYKESKKETRGIGVKIYEKNVKNDGISYKKIKYNGSIYYVKEENTTLDKEKIVKENTIFVRTPAVMYYKIGDPSIMVSTKKGEALSVIGYNKLNQDGSVDMYKVKYKEKQGYIYGKYTVLTEEESLANYNENNIYDIHKARGNTYGGGDAGNLDYYPVTKNQIKNNDMPEETRTLYINTAAVKRIEDYIQLAKKSNINAFVIDVKENTLPAYTSTVMSELSPSNYKKAVNTAEDYKKMVQKAKEANIYLIGRISAFKDQYYALDHPEQAILDTRTGKPYSHNNTYWPTAFSRDVWQYNVKLAIEAVKEMGFNEIQFDYVRFPDGTSAAEKSGAMDLRNTYGEDKASAIQQFLLYATDEIHKVGAYVSADVFGESASEYVTSYGQYWPAISNVVDVVSAMPYPDHFNKNEYGIKEPVWTVPYTLLKTWGNNYVVKRQNEIPTPAKTRTWIQAYNTIHEPYIVYDATKIEEQIKGLYDAGLTGGYITWNASSSLEKYKQIAPAFQKEYTNE